MATSLRTGAPNLCVLVAKGVLHDLCCDLTNEEAFSDLGGNLAQSWFQLVPRLQHLVQNKISIIVADMEGRTLTHTPCFSTSGPPPAS